MFRVLIVMDKRIGGKIIMKKKFMVAFFMVLASICYTTSGYAADLKIGVVDYERIIGQSVAAQKLRAEYYKEAEENNNKLIEKRNQVQALENEISSTMKQMTPAVLSEKRERYEREVKEYNRMTNDIKQDLENSQNYINQQLILEIGAIVSEYCEKENFTYILEANQVIAFSDSIDITDQILQLYDAAQ